MYNIEYHLHFSLALMHLCWMEICKGDHIQRHATTKAILLLRSHSLGISHTVHAIAVRTATYMCPLKTRSLQPPPALFKVLNQFSLPFPVCEGSKGLRILTKNCIRPHLGTYSGGYLSTSAATGKRTANDSNKSSLHKCTRIQWNIPTYSCVRPVSMIIIHQKFQSNQCCHISGTNGKTQW